MSLTSNSIGLLHVVRPTMPDRMTWRWRGIWTFHLVETNNSTNSHTYKQMTATCKSVILPSSLILVALVSSDLNYCNIVWVTPHWFSLNKLLHVTWCMVYDVWSDNRSHSARREKKMMSIHPYVHLNGTFPLNSEDTESAVPSVQVNSKPAVRTQLKRFLLVNHHYDYH